MRAVIYEGAQNVAIKEVEAAYGYAGMRPYRGGQAELLRIPFADVNCVALPGESEQQLLYKRGPPKWESISRSFRPPTHAPAACTEIRRDREREDYREGFSRPRAVGHPYRPFF
jgi:hypothetical protein